MYTAPYKQSAPNNRLTVHLAMSRQEPWLISNGALMHYDTTVGCDLEAPLKGGGIQQLDRVQGHYDRVTQCQPYLNLKVGKQRPHLGTLDPMWAKCSKRGQNFSTSGQNKFIHGVSVVVSPGAVQLCTTAAVIVQSTFSCKNLKQLEADGHIGQHFKVLC